MCVSVGCLQREVCLCPPLEREQAKNSNSSGIEEIQIVLAEKNTESVAAGRLRELSQTL